MRYFYCEDIKYGEIDNDVITEREKKHLFKVLRGETNAKIGLIDGKGSIGIATIKAGNSLVVDNIHQLPTPNIKLHLFVAPPRKNQMDQLLKQCSEIGVWSITPILTERSIAKPIKESSLERMNTILIEGCKQAHNPFTPKINPIIKLTEINNSNIQNISLKSPYNFFGSTKKCDSLNSDVAIEESSNKIKENNPETIENLEDNAHWWDSIKPSINVRDSQETVDIVWIVGPEGGFTDKEEDQLINLMITPLQFGKWVMRVETAAIVGASNLIEYFI